MGNGSELLGKSNAIAIDQSSESVTDGPDVAKLDVDSGRQGSVVGQDRGTSQEATLRGRSVFAVQTTGAGVMVRTAWLGEDNRLLEMPAVFPDMMYALSVLDDLRQQVIQHFSQAAQVGAQVIANQLGAQAQSQAVGSAQAMSDPQAPNESTG